MRMPTAAAVLIFLLVYTSTMMPSRRLGPDVLSRSFASIGVTQGSLQHSLQDLDPPDDENIIWISRTDMLVSRHMNDPSSLERYKSLLVARLEAMVAINAQEQDLLPSDTPSRKAQEVLKEFQELYKEAQPEAAQGSGVINKLSVIGVSQGYSQTNLSKLKRSKSSTCFSKVHHLQFQPNHRVFS